MKIMIISLITTLTISSFLGANEPTNKVFFEYLSLKNTFIRGYKSDSISKEVYFLGSFYQPSIDLGILIEKVDNGLLIIDILKGSPCANAGFVIGDLITKYNNTKLTEPSEFQQSIRSSLNGSRNKLTYISKGQFAESEMILTVQKNKNGSIFFKILSNKTEKINKSNNTSVRSGLSDIELEAYLTALRNRKNKIPEKQVDSIGTITTVDNLGNTTVTSLAGGGDGKKIKEIQKVNQKEVEEYLKQIKVSSATAEKYFADGKIPANIPVNFNNTTTVKDALNQLAGAGIKVDEAKVKKYLQQNGNKGDFATIQLNQVVPAEVMAVYGNNGQANKKVRVSRLSSINNPNSAAIIKQLEAMNNSVDGQKKGAKTGEGVADFNYIKKTGEKSNTKSSDNVGSSEISSKIDTTVSKDFIPASMLRKKPNINITETGKPIFIPASIPQEKKTGEKFITKDFVPFVEEDKNGKTQTVNVSSELIPTSKNNISNPNEKKGDKPVFIPSEKKVDKQSIEVERLIINMRKLADENLKLMQSKNVKEGKIKTTTSIDSGILKQKNNLENKSSIINGKKSNVVELVDSIQKNEPLKINGYEKNDSNVNTVDYTSSFSNDSLGSIGIVSTNPEKKILKSKENLTDKPVFIPSVKPTDKKANDKFVTKDFIPTQNIVKGSKQVDSTGTTIVHSIPERVADKIDEKNYKKPIFIPSTKLADKESEEINKLMREMKTLANAAMLKKKSINNADSVNYKNQPLKSSATDTIVNREKNKKNIGYQSFQEFKLATLGEILPASRVMSLMPNVVIESHHNGSIYYIGNFKSIKSPILPEKGNLFWKWLAVFLR